MLSRICCLTLAVLILGAVPAPTTMLLDDFQASLAYPEKTNYSAEIGTDARGNYVVAWMDRYPVTSGSAIYARAFNRQGVALTDPFQITTDTTLSFNFTFSLSMADSGHFAVAWRSKNGTAYRVYLRRYNKNFTPFDAGPIRINSNENVDVSVPDAAVNNAGHCIVVWATTRPQRPVGASVGVAVRPDPEYFNIDTAGSDPRVAVSDVDRFAVLYAFNLTGMKMAVFSMNSGVSTIHSPSSFPKEGTYDLGDIAMARSNGDIYVVWPTWNSTTMDIMGARFNYNGLAHDRPFYPEQGLSNNADRMVRVHHGSSNKFSITWASPSDRKMHFREYTGAGSIMSIGRIEIMPDLAAKNIYSLSSAVNNDGHVSVVCPSDGINLQTFRYNGEPMSARYKADMLGSTAMYPRTAVSAAGRFGVTWMGSAGKILLQQFATSLEPLRTPIEVNSTGAGSWPVLTMDTNAFAAWEDVRAGATDTSIWLQQYGSDGLSRSDNFRVSDLGVECGRPALAMGNGKLLAVWEDFRNGGSYQDIFGQWLTSSGQNTGGNFPVDSIQTAHCYRPDAAASGRGRFAVAWHSRSGTVMSPSQNVYLKVFDSQGRTAIARIQVNDVYGKGTLAAVAMDTANRIVVVWQDNRAGLFSYHVYGQRYLADGTPVGANFQVDADTLPKQYTDVAMAANGAFTVTWQSASASLPPMRILSHSFDFDLTPHSGPVPQNADSLRTVVAAPSIAAAGDRVFTAWMNCHSTDLQQRDIWGQVSSLRDSAVTARELRPLSPARIGLTVANPMLGKVWRNGTRQAVSVYDPAGRLIQKVGPGEQLSFTKSGIYLFRSASGKEFKIVALR